MTMLNVFINNIFRSRDYLYINIIVFFISLMMSTLYLEQSNDYTSMFIFFPMNVAHLNMVGSPWHRSEHFSPLKSRSYIWSTEDRIIILHQVKLSFKSASLSTEDSFFFFFPKSLSSVAPCIWKLWQQRGWNYIHTAESMLLTVLTLPCRSLTIEDKAVNLVRIL